MHAVDDAGRGGDEIEIELARQPLLDDFEVQEPKEAAAEAEAERGAGFHFVGEARVVEAELRHGGAQIFEIGGVLREETAEHDGLRRLEARQRLRRLAAIFGDGVADARVGDFLDASR